MTDIERQHDELAELISRSFSESRDKERTSKFLAGCLQIMYAHKNTGVVGPDFLPDEIGYAHFLNSIGFLEEHPKGKSLQPIRYEFTDTAREFLKRDY